MFHIPIIHTLLVHYLVFFFIIISQSVSLIHLNINLIHASKYFIEYFYKHAFMSDIRSVGPLVVE